jgi:aminopeptidase N
MAASDRDILPNTIKPLNYDLSLYNLEFGGSWGYDGLVKIQAQVSPTKEVVLNTKELRIISAHVMSNGKKVASMTEVTDDQTNERATINLDNELPSGDAVIAIEFKGTMNDSMAGFYRSKYKPTVTPVSFGTVLVLNGRS